MTVQHYNIVGAVCRNGRGTFGGGLAGWLGGHAAIGLAGPAIERRTGVSVGMFELAPPPRALDLRIDHPVLEALTSSELLLVPGLIGLAILVGFLPAMAAYRTDVARSLSANP